MRVLIIGAGFSGAMVTAHLLGSHVQGEIWLADPSGHFARGAAYTTISERHLLNVVAGSMSAFPDQADHFLRWAQAQDPTVTATDFLPRGHYGRYLESVLEAADCSNPSCTVRRIQGEVHDLSKTPEGFVAKLNSGQTESFDRVVLALGNFPPAELTGTSSEVLASPNYFANPWEGHWVKGLELAESVAIIGTGLTAADVVVELVGRGFTGEIQMVSRHGHLPLVHLAGEPSHAGSELTTCQGSLRQKMKLLRRLARQSQEQGGGWQHAMDDLRPSIIALWQGLTDTERKTFLRHLRPYWDIHRHRVAPQIGETVYGALDRGHLKVHAAQVRAMDWDGQSFVVTGKRRDGQGELVLKADRIINCSGPKSTLKSLDSSLIQSLVLSQTIEPDALGLGIRCVADGQAVGAEGLYVIGSLRRGELWETTAVRELRVQAKTVADALLSQ